MPSHQSLKRAKSSLIQDEIFALSDKFSKWFSDKKNADILRKCFDIGSLVILKHPSFAYPTDEFRELASEAPIYARAKYIQKYGTRADNIFTPSPEQLTLYHEIDSWLQKSPSSQRSVGSLQDFDILSTFGYLLKDVLSFSRYKNWRASAFKGISDKMADDFVGFIEDPTKVVARLREKNKDFNIVSDSEGKPTFNRSLGYLAASLYPPEQAQHMQRLIQTTFAAPFTLREKASGRYSNFLRELLWVPLDFTLDEYEEVDGQNIVAVEAHVDTDLMLPDINTNFVEIIGRVRNSPAGKNLRQTMRQIEFGINFNKQIEAWNEVADELAKAVTRKKPVKVRDAVLRVGGDLVYGSIAYVALNTIKKQEFDIPGTLEETLLAGGIGLVCGHIKRVLQSDLQRQDLRENIERAVEFRCSPFTMSILSTPVKNRI